MRTGLSRCLSGKESTCNAKGIQFNPCLGKEKPMDKEMVTHPHDSCLKHPKTEVIGRLQSIEPQRSWS